MGLTDGGVLYGINQSIHHVDMVIVVIPGAFGCLITGFLYSAFSNWGFCKEKWLIFKWIVTITAILFGTFFLGPWETAIMEISGTLGRAPLNDQSYLYNQKMNVIFGGIQCIVLMIHGIYFHLLSPGKKEKIKLDIFK